jgi:hypothetical protein
MVDEITDGVMDELTGEVVWDLNISAGGVKGKEIGYTVKYPKNASISLKRYRTVSAAYF